MAEKVVRITNDGIGYRTDDGRLFGDDLKAILGSDLPQRVGWTNEYRIKLLSSEFPLPRPDDGVSQRWEFDRSSHPGKDCRRADFLFRKGPHLDAWYCMDDQGMQYFVWVGKLGFDSAQGIWSFGDSRETAKAFELGLIQPYQRYEGPEGGKFIGWVGITDDPARFDCWFKDDRVYLRGPSGSLIDNRAREYENGGCWNDAYRLAVKVGLAGPRHEKDYRAKVFLGRFGEIDGWYGEDGKYKLVILQEKLRADICTPFASGGVREEVCREAEAAGLLEYQRILDAKAKVRELNSVLEKLEKVNS